MKKELNQDFTLDEGNQATRMIKIGKAPTTSEMTKNVAETGKPTIQNVQERMAREDKIVRLGNGKFSRCT